jgi:hypothetical protein
MQPTPTPTTSIPVMSEARWDEATKISAADPRLQLPELLRRLRAKGWQPKVVFTWRSPATQAELVRQGKSGVSFSFHNAVSPGGRPAALAADIADKRYLWGVNLDGSTNEVKTAHAAAFFAVLGAEAKAMGLSWGGDWTKRASVWTPYGMGFDPAHVQALSNSELRVVKADHVARGLV